MSLSYVSHDHLVINTPRKRILVKATREGRGIVVNTKALNKNEAEYIDFDPGEVIANLGQTPLPGRTYGIEVEPLYSKSELDHWGEVFYHRRLPQQERVNIEKTLVRLGKKLVSDGIFPSMDFYVAIRANQSQRVGYWRHYTNGKKPDELCLQLPDFNNRKDIRLYAAHEAGHGIWFSRMNAAWQGKWIKAYNRNITLAKVTSDQIERIREELLEAQQVKAFNKTLDDEHKSILREILKYIRRTHSLQARHIDVLIENGDDLKEIWPQTRFALSKREVIVSEYAMKAPDEFWCEAFMFYYCEEKVLPKEIVKLIEKTIAAIKAGGGSSRSTHEEDD